MTRTRRRAGRAGRRSRDGAGPVSRYGAGPTEGTPTANRRRSWVATASGFIATRILRPGSADPAFSRHRDSGPSLLKPILTRARIHSDLSRRSPGRAGTTAHRARRRRPRFRRATDRKRRAYSGRPAGAVAVIAPGSGALRYGPSSPTPHRPPGMLGRGTGPSVDQPPPPLRPSAAAARAAESAGAVLSLRRARRFARARARRAADAGPRKLPRVCAQKGRALQLIEI